MAHGDTDGLTTIKAFAAAVGVSRQAVEHRIRRGGLTAYSADGAALPASAKGRKFVRRDAVAQWNESRARIDDADLARLEDVDLSALAPVGRDAAPLSLPAAKTDREQLAAEVLRLRLARERGELVARQAAIDAFQSLGILVKTKISSITSWSEDLEIAVRSGGIAELTRILKIKLAALQEDLADDIATASAEGADASSSLGDDEASQVEDD